MEKSKYSKTNPKFRAGQVWVHKNKPDYIIKLLHSDGYHWICKVISGEPFPGTTQSSDLYMNNIRKNIVYDEYKSNKIIEYTTASLSTSFKKSTMAEILYSEDEIKVDSTKK